MFHYKYAPNTTHFVWKKKLSKDETIQYKGGLSTKELE